MLISRTLLAESARRLSATRMEPARLAKSLGDGPLDLTVTKKRERFAQVLAETGDADRASILLERIISGNDLDSINYLSKGTEAARSVCRIQIRDGAGTVVGFATGFMIGPGVLMTNHHVFGEASEATRSLAEFDYELDIRGEEREPVRFGFDPAALFYANLDLDFAIVAVRPQSEDGRRDLTEWGWLSLSGAPGKGDTGEYLTIVQHPNAERKQVCVRENKLLKYDGDFVWYATDTLGGSSGSPVFNRFWQVMALHHSGVPRTNSKGQYLTKNGKVWDESMDESLIDWIANEGIRVSSLVKHLGQALGTDPRVKTVLDAVPPPRNEVMDRPMNRAPRGETTDAWIEQTGDRASLVVPLRVPLDLVRREVVPPTPGPAPTGPPIKPVDPSNSLPIEAVHINQKTLGTRPGYNERFLGTGKLGVPLPTLSATLRSKAASLIKAPTDFELKYFNYSVVHNKVRKLAFFSAVNIDGNLRQDVGKREGDSWLRDPRIKSEFQIGDEFYGKQKAFEASRARNPFDRGHLVRRLDGTWGKDVAQAKEHGDDTFHFTNATPQFFAFNQGRKLWLGLEEFVLDKVEADKRKACVINGPVFDGPEAPEGGLPNASDPPKADPVFGGVAIPKYFWKLLVVRRGGDLVASAFLLSQQDQIMGIDRIHESAMLEKLTQAEARVFQISIVDLSKFTKLGFGSLSSVDSKETLSPAPRQLRSLDDVHV